MPFKEKNITITIENEQYEKLKICAENAGKSINQVINEYIQIMLASVGLLDRYKVANSDGMVVDE